MKQLFIGKAIYQSKINPIVITAAYEESAFLYVPKENLPLVESWLKIPTEEIVSKILKSPRIKTVKVGGLLNIMSSNKGDDSYRVPREVGTIGARIMRKLTEIKNDKERVRNEHIDEDLLEMVR